MLLYENEGQMLSKCIITMLDEEINELIEQGDYLKMSVKYKMTSNQDEDLDQSLEIGVDSQPVHSINEIQFSSK